MGDRLKGKVAVVTGSGRGIGRAEALTLASEGAKVVVNDLGVERDGTGTAAAPADEVVEEIKKAGGEAVANYDSIAEPDSAAKVIQTAVDAFGQIDILVNNAGFGRDRFLHQDPPALTDPRKQCTNRHPKEPPAHPPAQHRVADAVA